MNHVFEYEFNSARNALRVLVREFKIKKLHLPFYLCPVLRNALRQEGCEIEFYHIDKNFFPVSDFSEKDFVLYPNYFGICTKNVMRLSQEYPNLIVDSAHAFYSEHFGFASINSYRKFFFNSFGLKDGACLTINEPLANTYEQDETKYEQIKNIYDYNELLKNEKRVDEFEILTISECSEKILSEINFEKDKKERREKFFELDEMYSPFNELSFKLGEIEVPFVYPLLSKDEKLQMELTKNNDLILRYWTNLPQNFTEYDFYKYLLPVPLTNLI